MDEPCTLHSGIEQRMKLVLWLLAIIIAISGWQIKMLVDVKESTAGFSYRLESLQQADKTILDKIATLERRIDSLEKARR